MRRRRHCTALFLGCSPPPRLLPWNTATFSRTRVEGRVSDGTGPVAGIRWQGQTGIRALQPMAPFALLALSLPRDKRPVTA